MKNFPEHAMRPHLRVEANIISRAIGGFLKGGCAISVFDGEEFAVQKSTSRAEIEAECFATEETTFNVWKDGKKIGFVWFIHGNGHDVISDYSDSPELEAMMASAIKFGETA